MFSLQNAYISALFEKMKKLSNDFYNRENVFEIAKELLGKVLVTNFNNKTTSGRIVECEAYDSIYDKASHAFGGRRSYKNEVMYADAGTAYVYICYGIHHLFNVVTNKKDIPHAILIRALEPLLGIDLMLARRNKSKADFTLTKGPGSLSIAMGINKNHNGALLTGNEIHIADDGFKVEESMIAVSKRIGVESAGEAADYLYRYYLKDNKYVSGKK